MKEEAENLSEWWKERAEKAEKMVSAIDEAIADRGVPERDCTLPLPDRVSNIISELKEWRHAYAEAAQRAEKAEAERDERGGGARSE